MTIEFSKVEGTNNTYLNLNRIDEDIVLAGISGIWDPDTKVLKIYASKSDTLWKQDTIEIETIDGTPALVITQDAAEINEYVDKLIEVQFPSTTIANISTELLDATERMEYLEGNGVAIPDNVFAILSGVLEKTDLANFISKESWYRYIRVGREIEDKVTRGLNRYGQNTDHSYYYRRYSGLRIFCKGSTMKLPVYRYNVFGRRYIDIYGVAIETIYRVSGDKEELLESSLVPINSIPGISLVRVGNVLKDNVIVDQENFRICIESAEDLRTFKMAQFQASVSTSGNTADSNVLTIVSKSIDEVIQIKAIDGLPVDGYKYKFYENGKPLILFQRSSDLRPMVHTVRIGTLFADLDESDITCYISNYFSYDVKIVDSDTFQGTKDILLNISISKGNGSYDMWAPRDGMGPEECRISCMFEYETKFYSVLLPDSNIKLFNSDTLDPVEIVSFTNLVRQRKMIVAETEDSGYEWGYLPMFNDEYDFSVSTDPIDSDGSYIFGELPEGRLEYENNSSNIVSIDEAVIKNAVAGDYVKISVKGTGTGKYQITTDNMSTLWKAAYSSSDSELYEIINDPDHPVDSSWKFLEGPGIQFSNISNGHAKFVLKWKNKDGEIDTFLTIEVWSCRDEESYIGNQLVVRADENILDKLTPQWQDVGEIYIYKHRDGLDFSNWRSFASRDSLVVPVWYEEVMPNLKLYYAPTKAAEDNTLPQSIRDEFASSLFSETKAAVDAYLQSKGVSDVNAYKSCICGTGKKYLTLDSDINCFVNVSFSGEMVNVPGYGNRTYDDYVRYVDHSEIRMIHDQHNYLEFDVLDLPSDGYVKLTITVQAQGVDPAKEGPKSITIYVIPEQPIVSAIQCTVPTYLTSNSDYININTLNSQFNSTKAFFFPEGVEDSEKVVTVAFSSVNSNIIGVDQDWPNGPATMQDLLDITIDKENNTWIWLSDYKDPVGNPFSGKNIKYTAKVRLEKYYRPSFPLHPMARFTFIDTSGRALYDWFMIFYIPFNPYKASMEGEEININQTSGSVLIEHVPDYFKLPSNSTITTNRYLTDADSSRQHPKLDREVEDIRFDSTFIYKE